MKKKIQQLYMDFFALHQRFQREGDEIEIAWGHGLLSWNVKGEKIQRPFVVTRLELQFDAKKGVFFLLPTSKGTQMETDMLNQIPFPNASRLQEMEREMEELEFDPRDKDLLTPFLREIIHTISPEGKLMEDEAVPNKMESVPRVTYSPVLFLRKSRGRVWQNELSSIIQKIKEGFPVPDTIGLLTTTIGDGVQSEHQSSSDPSWNMAGEELLFPLPTNMEQKLIAKKLASSPGLIVQGPPGTGKSHTIVNLISHLLAHGKRVLVTSEKERALQVLRDKIPEEIRSLCVSVLGGDSRSVKEIEDSIKQIAENLDSKQPEVLLQNIIHLQKELDKTRRRMAEIQYQINQTMEQENQSIKFGDETFTPLEMGMWLTENESFNWLPDSVDIHDSCPLTDEELLQFFIHLGSIQNEDKNQLTQHRPNLEEIPTPSEFEKNIQIIESLEQKKNESEQYILGWTLPNDIPADLEPYKQSISDVLGYSFLLDKTWFKTLVEDTVSNDNYGESWKEFLKETNERIRHLEELDRPLLEYELTLPSTKNEMIVKEDLTALMKRMKEKKSIGWLFKNVLGRKYAYLFEECRVNELPIRSADDVKVLIQWIDRNDLKKKLALKWNRMMEPIQGESIDPSAQRFSYQVTNLIHQIEKALDWNHFVVKPVTSIIHALGAPSILQWTDVHSFQAILQGIEALEDRRNYTEACTFLNNVIDMITKGKESRLAHSSWMDMMRSVQERDIPLWNEVYKELLRLQELEAPYQQYENYKKKLEKIAPKWVNHWLDQGGKGTPLIPPTDWKKAWKWSQGNTWLHSLHVKVNIDELEEKLTLERKNESKLIRRLVAESTWKKQIERTTKAQKTSLHAWMNAIKRIGKGTGKYANVYRKEASQEMKTCRSAIPVWIMPIQKVIENIQLTNDLFDVVIVDESSQSNLFALCALLRGKKAVIVGDDNQISPESVGTDVQEIHALIDRYLLEIPHRQRYEMTTSLYDMANQVFDHKIVLKEHFRCVPEIIQFSNDLMYGGKMDRLRLPMAHEMLVPPVQTVRVPDGYREESHSKVMNNPEAEAIVQRILNMSSDPSYDGKTFGVISLQGHDQAKLIESLLREALGEEEMMVRKLICGDAYSFQGDERDVIILSMVAAENMPIGPLIKRSDYQRFNVAASRARDQMLLFHSVDLNRLNPNCARYRLLQYCLDPQRVQEEIEQVEELFDTQFEKDVYRLISSRGYRVLPQVEVGTVGNRIDLVVEGLRNRLAIECDGDKWHGLNQWEADIERQRILERVGWTFWRVRGSVFYRDQEKALESLWAKLTELDIYPRTQNNQENLELVDISFPPNEKLDLVQMTLEDIVAVSTQEIVFDLVSYLVEQGLEVIDHRPSGGALWMVGDMELSPMMRNLAVDGFPFTFAKGGGKATRKRPGWYLK